MLTDNARKYKYQLHIGQSIYVEWLDYGIKYKRKTKVFNVADVYFTTADGNAIFYNDILNLVIQEDLI